MCRLLCYCGKPTKRLNTLIELLVKASERDPLLYRVSNGRRLSHSDGWGFILYTTELLYHYRSIKPIYSDEKGVERLQEIISSTNSLILILHTRAASSGSISLYNTHPICINSMAGMVCIAHNGTMDKTRLADLLRTPDNSLVSDTYMLGVYMTKKLEEKHDQLLTALDVVDALIRPVLPMVKTALNALILIKQYTKAPSPPLVIITSYFKPRDNDADAYYRLYQEKTNMYVAYYSSTTHLYDKEKRGEPLRNGVAHVITMKDTIVEVGEYRLEPS